jgi:hypothetical protein
MIMSYAATGQKDRDKQNQMRPFQFYFLCSFYYYADLSIIVTGRKNTRR